MRKGLFSIRIELDEVLRSDDYKQLVFENLQYCKRVVGLKFHATFWCNKLDRKIIKEFTDKNKDKLSDLSATITMEPGSVWFLIKSSNEEKSSARYIYDGDILNGIVEYLGIINHMKRLQTF